MSAKNNKDKPKSKQIESTQETMNQPTRAFAALTLTGPKEPSTIPKPIPTVETAPEEMVEGSDDVIFTNHFPCSFARDLTFYQYDVIVEEYHERQQRFIEVSNREKRRQFVLDLFLAKTIHPTGVCWYDEGYCIYSTTDFKDKLPFVHEKEERGYQHRLTIKSLSTTSGTNDLDQSSIRVIETLIKQVLKEQFKVIGQIFYRWDAESRQEGPYDLLTGFRQALCLTESGPTLNVDTTITRFYPHLDLLPFIWERLLEQNGNSFRGIFSDEQYNRIGNRLKDIEVTTAQSDHQKKYVLTGRFSNKLPENILLPGKGNLLDYYKDLEFDLRFPRLYCVEAHPFNKSQHLVDLPIELCSLREWQQVKEDESAKPVPAPPVSDRYHSIMTAIRSCNFADDILCKEIQLEVDSESMMAIPYEILAKRQIILGRKGAFTKPISIDRMGFIYLTDRTNPYAKQVADKLLNNFYDAAEQQKIRLPQNPDEYVISANRNLEEILRDRLSKLKAKQCQFILCLENCRNPEIHQLFKQIAYTESGLVTQCVNFANVQRIPNLRSYCKNLLNSVNAKLNGENKQIAELKTSIKTMFVGADVQHTKNNYSGELPSIAAVVASMNSQCTSTTQRASRQWPSQGKQSEEAILLLKDMVEELLIAFKENNSGVLPEHVIFYRDGVDDGQFERVLDEEVTALKNAFQQIYPKNSSSPLLTFIVVKKRHNTRLFRVSPPSVPNASDMITNVESGIVVDNSIVQTNPNYLNFFLNSHEPRLGTNKIGNYVVLVNEIEYSLNDLEEITYSLCHTDQRIDSRSSESIPSIIHLADAAASRARQLFDDSTRPPNGARAEILRVHGDMENRPNMF